MQNKDYEDMSCSIKCLSADAVAKAKSGHPGLPLGMADVVSVLYKDFLKFYPEDPLWLNRDRFVLSAGHGSMLLYSLLHLTGYKKLTMDQIKHFRQFGSLTAGHPEYDMSVGIETTTGPLGQGFANAIGMAISEKKLRQKFSSDIIDHFTYVIVGDGCLMEGISHETASLAGHLQLSKLIVFFDDNNVTIDGNADITCSDDQHKRFLSYNWEVQEIDGHSYGEIFEAIKNAQKSDKPSLIICKTVIASGLKKHEGQSSGHSAVLGDEDIEEIYSSTNWERVEPFYVPDSVRDLWLNIGKNNKSDYDNWYAKYNSYSKKGDFDSLFKRMYRGDVDTDMLVLKKQLLEDKTAEASRKSSGRVLSILHDNCDFFLGGSADLTPSNNTKTKDLKALLPEDFSDGRYVHYGIREHAMGACMNGISLYGAFVPYGGTFLTFLDYCRPAIRLAALMKQKVIYIATHDSIGLGEDGPTHQPIEQIMSLRLIPNVFVMRPADTIETVECWEAAMKIEDGPVVIVLSRQNLDFLDCTLDQYDTHRGAYVISDAEDSSVTLFASGSELSLALQAKEKLSSDGIITKVISVPCWELFFKQDDDYIHSIICQPGVKIAIEAGSGLGWEKFIGVHGSFVGMRSFGASAPYKDLYKNFGITVDDIIHVVKSKIQS